jgi:hypothetical protein
MGAAATVDLVEGSVRVADREIKALGPRPNERRQDRGPPVNFKD